MKVTFTTTLEIPKRDVTRIDRSDKFQFTEICYEITKATEDALISCDVAESNIRKTDTQVEWE